MKTIKNYPRPQFVRDSWLSLNGKWKFVFDDENVGEEKQFFYKFPNFNEILVPFTYETKMSGINDETVHENIWYSNDININVEKDKNIKKCRINKRKCFFKLQKFRKDRS